MNNVLLIFSVFPEYEELYFIEGVSDSELEQMKTINNNYLNQVGDVPVYLDLLNLYLTSNPYIDEAKNDFDDIDDEDIYTHFNEMRNHGLTRDDIGKFNKFKIESDEILELKNISNLTVIRTGMNL